MNVGKKVTHTLYINFLFLSLIEFNIIYFLTSFICVIKVDQRKIIVRNSPISYVIVELICYKMLIIIIIHSTNFSFVQQRKFLQKFIREEICIIKITTFLTLIANRYECKLIILIFFKLYFF